MTKEIVELEPHARRLLYALKQRTDPKQSSNTVYLVDNEAVALIDGSMRDLILAQSQLRELGVLWTRQSNRGAEYRLLHGGPNHTKRYFDYDPTRIHTRGYGKL